MLSATNIPFIESCDLDPDSSLFRLTVVMQAGAMETEAVRKAVSEFLNAITLGMFARVPELLTGEYVRSVTTQGMSANEMSWDIRGIDASAFRVLVNLLSQASFISTPPFSVRLRSLEGDKRRCGSADIVSLPYAACPPQLPFELTGIELNNISYHPVIRLTFARALSDEEAEVIDGALVTWTWIAAQGGYMEQPIRLERSLIQDNESYPVSPDTWECSLYGFRAAAASFASLLRFAIRFHYHRCPLLNFEIEL